MKTNIRKHMLRKRAYQRTMQHSIIKHKVFSENLNLFERNKISLELKILGLALYIQLSSLRRVAKALSETHKTSKTAIWVRKLSKN